MSVATQIHLNKFKVRPYQYNFAQAFENRTHRKYLACWPRRSGKDFTIFNLVLRAAIRNRGSYFYCLPTFRQARLVIWESITNAGIKFLDCIPRELIKRQNNQDMVIELTNGSILRLVGSDNFDTNLVGTNTKLIVFSEFALADSRAYKLALPIINANDGTIAIISTPRGHNAFYDLYQIALNNPKEWYCERLTVDDTQHIPIELIQNDIASGEMSKELARQEYWSDFSLGIAGTYYGKYMEKMRLDERIAMVQYEPEFPVHCAFDLGVHDPTCIVFFQVIGRVIHIIDYYQNNSEGLEHYADILTGKKYRYGQFFAPHDIKVQSQSTGITRAEYWVNMGMEPFIITPRYSLEDGIEAVRRILPRCWIDQCKCKDLIRALENYRRKFDESRGVHYEKPVHDMFSHPADAFRYMALNVHLCGDSKSAEELDAQYNRIVYGQNQNLPDFFR